MPKNLRVIKMVENDLHSQDSIAQAYAMRACCMFELSSPKIIEGLKKLKQSTEVAMWQKISEVATATLDIIGVEKYNGDNPAIIEIIRTKDYSEK